MPYAFDPDWVISPGVLVREVIEEWNLSPRLLAVICRVDESAIEMIMDGLLPINDRVARGLSVLGTQPQFWLSMEAIYRNGLAAGKIDASD